MLAELLVLLSQRFQLGKVGLESLPQSGDVLDLRPVLFAGQRKRLLVVMDRGGCGVQVRLPAIEFLAEPDEFVLLAMNLSGQMFEVLGGLLLGLFPLRLAGFDLLLQPREVVGLAGKDFGAESDFLQGLGRLAATFVQLVAKVRHLLGQLRLGLFQAGSLRDQKTLHAGPLLAEGPRELVGPTLGVRGGGGRVFHGCRRRPNFDSLRKPPANMGAAARTRSAKP